MQAWEEKALERADGRKEGLTEGAANARKEIAQNLLNTGIPKEEDAKLAGLTLDDVVEIILQNEKSDS